MFIYYVFYRRRLAERIKKKVREEGLRIMDKMPKRNVLRSQARQIVYNVSQFMKKEADNGLQIEIKAAQKRAASATGISITTVRRIRADVNRLNCSAAFRTPGKKRSNKRRITGIDSSHQGLIRRLVHSYHTKEGTFPTIGNLSQKLKQLINFNGSETSLRRILKQLGFRFARTEVKKLMLIEKTSLRLKRIEYLNSLTSYRAEGRPIIYTGESYIDSTQIQSGSVKPERIVLVHAGSGAGFVPNAFVIFKSGTKTENYHDNINFNNYEKWVGTQLMPNLPPNSVVVVDNARHYNKRDDSIPTSNSPKTEMQRWLREKGIEFCATMLKPQLYKLIAMNKDRYKNYNIDQILKENNHPVLQLPPYHPDLNPMELVWEVIKGHVASKKLSKIDEIIDIIKVKVNAMGEFEWVEFCSTVKQIEEEYKNNEHMLDCLTDEIVIKVNSSESESEEKDDEITASESDESDSDTDNSG